MKNFILTLLNDTVIGILFILACYATHYNTLLGLLAFVIAYVGLDIHTYFAKKLNFYNNLFIKL